MTVRTRFAPSPTGYLHVGGIRTALFAYLVARQAGGQFVLRFEDTDKKREVAGSAEHLIASLKAIGIDYDEGPDIGGPYGPYIQSQRLERYRAVADQLVKEGRAYADPYTAQDMERFRAEAVAAKKPFLYRNHRPENPPVWDGSQPLRFKSDPKNYDWHDEVMGDMQVSPEVIDDFILLKSDGYPTYNFAHIIDDRDMAITHIMRGQEFLSSMPNYLNLYEALDIDLPVFAHLPHIMNEQGNKKLGKRDGAKDVLDYIRDGYLGEAMMSFIATMGWNDGTEQEIFSREELVAKFSLGKVQRSGARFDEKRLLWVNGQFMRSLDLEDLYARSAQFWPAEAADATEDYRKQVLALAQDRLKTLDDLRGFSYFFANPSKNQSLITDNKQLKKLEPSEIGQILQTAHTKLTAVEQWDAAHLQQALNELLEETGQRPGVLFSLIRIYTTWAPFSPELAPTLALIGKAAVLDRLQIANP
ncbi:MAG: glutamate--tRNA ligase [Candidatus Saccharimonadales bacterium]